MGYFRKRHLGRFWLSDPSGKAEDDRAKAEKLLAESRVEVGDLVLR